MPSIAVTRLRVRSFRFLLPFARRAWRSFRQAKHAAGGLGAKLRKAEGLAFWTLSAWQDESAMNAFRITPPHRDAMPKLRHWCDEAAYVHWNQESAGVAGLGSRREASCRIRPFIQSESSISPSTSRTAGLQRIRKNKGVKSLSLTLTLGRIRGSNLYP